MRKVAKTLAGVHTHTHTHTHTQVFLQNKKINKENSVNKISAISSPKNKELYIAKTIYSSFCVKKNNK